jgi:hypothetical protein
MCTALWIGDESIWHVNEHLWISYKVHVTQQLMHKMSVYATYSIYGLTLHGPVYLPMINTWPWNLLWHGISIHATYMQLRMHTKRAMWDLIYRMHEFGSILQQEPLYLYTSCKYKPINSYYMAAKVSQQWPCEFLHPHNSHVKPSMHENNIHSKQSSKCYQFTCCCLMLFTNTCHIWRFHMWSSMCINVR